MGEVAYVVLFRGVGGATLLPVRELRAHLEEGGFRHVSTYINSGNAVLASPLAEGEVAEHVTAIVRACMGFDKHVFVRSLADWTASIEANPFVKAEAEPTKLHLYTLEREPEPEAVARLKARAKGTERFAVRGRTLYLHTPDGMGTSLFAQKIEPTLGLAATARNWRTVLKLGEMLRKIPLLK